MATVPYLVKSKTAHLSSIQAGRKTRWIHDPVDPGSLRGAISALVSGRSARKTMAKDRARTFRIGAEYKKALRDALTRCGTLSQNGYGT